MIFNSTIISNNSFYSAELASILASVVGQVESKWELCYNALADGWSPQIFHTNCDNIWHTVTIIKKETYIFGGYTDIPWGNYQFPFIYLKQTNGKKMSEVKLAYYHNTMTKSS